MIGRTGPLRSVRRPGAFPLGVEAGGYREPGPVRLDPSMPGANGPEKGIYIRLPGVNFPPAGAIPIDVDGDANIAPGTSATLLTIQVPDTMRFRMVGIGFGADDETALRFLTWTIQFNGVSQSGYSQKNAVIGTIVQLTEIFISVGSSQTVTVVGTADSTAVVTYRFIARARGYHYGEKEGD